MPAAAASETHANITENVGIYQLYWTRAGTKGAESVPSLNLLSVHWIVLLHSVDRLFSSTKKNFLFLAPLINGHRSEFDQNSPSTGAEIWKWRHLFRKTKALLLSETSFRFRLFCPIYIISIFKVCYATYQLFWYHLIQLCMVSFHKVQLKLLYFLLTHLNHVIIVSSLLLPDGNLQLEPLPPESLPYRFYGPCLYMTGIKNTLPFSQSKSVFFLVQFSWCFEGIGILLLFSCG